MKKYEQKLALWVRMHINQSSIGLDLVHLLPEVIFQKQTSKEKLRYLKI